MAIPQPPRAKPAPPRARSAQPRPTAVGVRPRRDAGDAATYRSFLTAPAGQPLLDVVDQQLEVWLEHKQRGAWEQIRVNTPPMDLLQATGAPATSYQHRTVQYLRGAIPGGTGLRLTMQERGGHGTGTTWTTQVTAFEPVDGAAQGWVAIDITNDNGEFCATPRLASDLLKAITLYDGISPMRGRIRVLDSTEQLLQLNKSLLDPQRRYPIVVVGSGDAGDLDEQLFFDKVKFWTNAIAGQGQVVFLNHHATQMSNQLLPERLRTPAWTLRTFLPGLDPENPEEWSRHRVLSTRSLGRRPDPQIRGIITNSARTAAHASEFPPEVDEVTALLRRRMRNDTIAARRTRPHLHTPLPTHPPTVAEPVASETMPSPVSLETPVGDLSTPVPSETPDTALLAEALEQQVLQALGLEALNDAAIAHVVERLTAPEVDTDLLTAYIDEQDHDLDQARTDLAKATRARQEAEDLAGELQSLNTDLEGANTTLREQNRYLQTELAKTNAAAAYALPAAPEELDDFFEIMDRIDELTRVEFTGDMDIALELSGSDHNGSEARTAWRALVSLDSYARHHLAGEVRTFKEYTEGAGPGDCRIGAGKCVPTESSTTVNQFGRHRIFPVPREVEPSEKVMMLAHIRLGQSDTRAPRLHYYDDVDGTGKIYVGYIGPHLPNPQTARS